MPRRSMLATAKLWPQALGRNVWRGAAARERAADVAGQTSTLRQHQALAAQPLARLPRGRVAFLPAAWSLA